MLWTKLRNPQQLQRARVGAGHGKDALKHYSPETRQPRDNTP